jgi:hypothetical protein
MKTLHNTTYNPLYPWRPKYFWDHCPVCFENFDLSFQCHNCGSNNQSSVKMINSPSKMNNTTANLQDILGYKPSKYGYKDTAPHIRCKDGTTLSVQASRIHYCSPKSDKGPYKTVEVWCIDSKKETIPFTYDPQSPAGYVPIEDVVAFIDSCGGMV